MSHRRVDAAAATRWLGRGWQLFTRSAGTWIGTALAFGVIVLADRKSVV